MEDAALHCAHRNAQFISNFVVMEPVEKHREWLPEIILEIGDRRLNVIDVDERRHGIVVVILTGIQEVLILSLIHNCVLEALSLVVIDENVPHNGI